MKNKLTIWFWDFGFYLLILAIGLIFAAITKNAGNTLIFAGLSSVVLSGRTNKNWLLKLGQIIYCVGLIWSNGVAADFGWFSVFATLLAGTLVKN